MKKTLLSLIAFAGIASNVYAKEQFVVTIFDSTASVLGVAGWEGYRCASCSSHWSKEGNFTTYKHNPFNFDSKGGFTSGNVYDTQVAGNSSALYFGITHPMNTSQYITFALVNHGTHMPYLNICLKTSPNSYRSEDDWKQTTTQLGALNKDNDYNIEIVVWYNKLAISTYSTKGIQHNYLEIPLNGIPTFSLPTKSQMPLDYTTSSLAAVPISQSAVLPW